MYPDEQYFKILFFFFNGLVEFNLINSQLMCHNKKSSFPITPTGPWVSNAVRAQLKLVSIYFSLVITLSSSLWLTSFTQQILSHQRHFLPKH